MRAEHIGESAITLEIEGVRNALTEVRDRASAKGARDVSVNVVIGDAAEQILAVAKDSQTDMIVMGTAGTARWPVSCSAALLRRWSAWRPVRCWSCTDLLPTRSRSWRPQ